MTIKHLLLILATLLAISCGGPGTTPTRVTGIYYQVRPGDTLASIARTYHVNPKKLAEINNIKRPDQLPEDTVIFIPNTEQALDNGAPPTPEAAKSENTREKAPAARLPAKSTIETKAAGPGKNAKEQKPKAKSAPSLVKDPDKSMPATPSPKVRKAPISQPLWQTPTPRQEDDGATPAGQTRPKQPPAASAKETVSPSERPDEVVSSERGRFSWPVKGKVANRFGLQPNGMYFNHIRIMAKENAPVAAAAAGTVIFSAPLKEFGETIIVKHDQRFATVYTHLGSRLVKTDHHVKKGEQIGLAGKSETKGEGYIHFEIRDNNKSRNPLLFLP